MDNEYIMKPRKNIAYLLFTLHIIIVLLPIYALFFTNNIKWITLSIFFYLSVLSLWYIFSCCIITIFENILLNGKINKDTCNNFVLSSMKKIDYKYNLIRWTNCLILLLCIIFTFIGVYKLYFLKSKMK